MRETEREIEKERRAEGNCTWRFTIGSHLSPWTALLQPRSRARRAYVVPNTLSCSLHIVCSVSAACMHAAHALTGVRVLCGKVFVLRSRVMNHHHHHHRHHYYHCEQQQQQQQQYTNTTTTTTNASMHRHHHRYHHRRRHRFTPTSFHERRSSSSRWQSREPELSGGELRRKVLSRLRVRKGRTDSTYYTFVQTACGGGGRRERVVGRHSRAVTHG